MVVAAEQGLLNEKSVKNAAEARLEVLQSYAVCHGRLREARYLTYFWISLLGRDVRVGSILETFLQLLNEAHLNVEKAQSLNDLAENLINTGNPDMTTEGRTHLKEARALFQNSNHNFGILDVSKLEYISTEASVTAAEDFERTQALAQAYHHLGVYQSSIRELAFAIPRALRFGGLSTQVRDSLETLTQWVEEVGGELLKQVVYMSSVSEALLHAPEYGPALRSIKSYITNPPSEIGPKNYGLLVQQLRRAYSGLGNVDEALVYAEKAFKIFSGGMSYIDKSDAAFDLALARWDCSQRYSNRSEDGQTWLKSAATLLQDWADNDARHEYHEGEQQKCAQLAIIRYHQASIDDDADMSLVAASWQDRAKSCNPSRAISRRAASTVELQVLAEIGRGNFDEALTIALNDVNAVESFPGPSTFENAQSCGRIATTLHMKVLHCLEHDAPHSEEVRQEMYSELLQAMGWAVKALNLYRSTIGAEVVVSCTNHLWLLIQDLSIFNESIAKDLSQAFVEEIGKTEKFCDEFRRSAASSNDIESWLQKRRIVSHKEHRKLYSAAVTNSIQLGDFSSAWMWNQKGKARGFSDLFGARALVPREILDSIRKDETAASLLDRERKSLEDYFHASPQALVGAARKVEADRAEMQSVPILARMLSIREGALDVNLQARELQTSLDICGILPERVRFIDWFIPVGKNGVANEVHIFVRDTTGMTESLQLSVTIPTVEAWVRKAYKVPDGAEPRLSRRDGNAFLSQLDGLLEGLDKLTNVNELLVLSPSGVLNSVPLHGLKVSGQRLIDRNMIVYSSSAAVLRQCLSIANARSGREETSSPKAAYFAVYEEPRAKEERAAIFENIGQLAEIFPGPVKLGPQVTNAEFKSGIAQSSMILFHGHAEYDADDPLKSALVLSDGCDIFDDSLEDQSFEASSSEAGRDFLTVSEIFESRMMDNAPHYTIVACDSSTQDIGAGDEPLGLLSALLYAGAASVLGCLWPIDSEAGRIFSRRFYTSLKEQMVTKSRPAEPNVLNLAAALRDAVREMMGNPDTDRPFFWAPFVLHGSWFHIPS